MTDVAPPRLVGDRAAILSHLVAALDRCPVRNAPFSHVYLDNVFPATAYDAMLGELPHLSLYAPDNPRKYARAAKRLRSRLGAQSAETSDGPISCRYTLPLNAATLARLPPGNREIWTDVAAVLTSVELKDRIFSLFADDLSRRFRTDRAGLNRIQAHPRPTLVRDLSGYWIAPHPDSRAKIVTVQFYLARDASQRTLGTALYRRRMFNPRILLSPDHLFTKVTQMEFLPNTGYGFPVTSRSWHGREEVPEDAGERNSILLFYYRDASREW